MGFCSDPGIFQDPRPTNTVLTRQLKKCHDLIAEGVIPSVRLGHRTLRIPVKKADAAMDKLADEGKLT